MRYDREDLQDLLAAEYVVGSMRGGARRRMSLLMQSRPALRLRVEFWEERMYPLEIRAPRVKAPRRLWQRIHARISPRAERAQARRQWWAGFAGASLSLALGALLFFGLIQWHAPVTSTVAVLHDSRARPAIRVSWTDAQRAGLQLSVRILTHPEMPAGTSWQAWLVRGDSPPIALGLITGKPEQLMAIPQSAAQALGDVGMIGVSVEPRGGSPDGRPSGPFLFVGQVQRVNS